MSAIAFEAARQAIHSGKGCTCRRGAKGDAEDAVTAALMALPKDHAVIERVAAIIATKFDEDVFDIAHLVLEAVAAPINQEDRP